MKFRYDKATEELVVTEATRIEYHQLELWLTRHVKGYKYMPAFKMGVWNGQQSYFRNGRINLGLWKEAMRGCKEIGYPFVLENKEDFPLNREVTLDSVRKFCEEYFKFHKTRTKTDEWVPFMPYDHQIESAYKILKNRYCMAEVATSGGKSLIISIVMFYTLKHINPDAKFLIIVPSITLVTQFYDNIMEYNFGINNLIELREKKVDSILNPDAVYSPCEIRVEEVMSERPRKFSGKENPNIYIGTYQSLEKWPKQFFQQFHTVVTDECLHPDSIINMSDGTLKKISEIKVGEYVKTINEYSKVIEDKKVEYVYENLSIDNDMYEIEMEDGRMLKITGNHKVYTKEFIWKKVEDLTVNDEILDFNSIYK
jgi:hypothetical protein